MFQFVGLLYYLFVKFSVYWQLLCIFFVNGIFLYVVRSFDKDKVVYICEWYFGNGFLFLLMYMDLGVFVEMMVEYIYMKSDENRGIYSFIIINCIFKVLVGVNCLGGLLVL